MPSHRTPFKFKRNQLKFQLQLATPSIHPLRSVSLAPSSAPPSRTPSMLDLAEDAPVEALEAIKTPTKQKVPEPFQYQEPDELIVAI